MTVILVYRPPQGDEWPQMEGKFLQLSWAGKEFLVFAPFELFGYHNQILARFMEDRGMAPQWIDAQSLAPPGGDLRVMGGGRFRIDRHANTLRLWDNSQAYGRFDGHGLAQRVAGAAHPWSACKVTVA